MKTHRVQQPFMKVSLSNMCSFFCQFYYRLVNTVHLTKKKSYCISVLILLLIFLGKIPIIGWVKVFDFSCGRHKWIASNTFNWNNFQFFCFRKQNIMKKLKLKKMQIFLWTICVTINVLFKSSMFASSLKLADVAPLHKKGRNV